MTNPELLNQVDHIYQDGEFSILDINELPYFDKDQYDLMDDKEFTKYMKSLERLVRNSFEYRELIKYLKNTEGMNVCSFLDNVTCIDTKVKIEIHHSPLTLYDICKAVLKKRISKRESININEVAEEVMYCHYICWVGLIPLSETIHDMVHNQYLFVPTDKVRGNYQAFVNAYYDYIDPDVLDCLDSAELATKEYNNKQMEILNQHKIYINANGSYGLPRKDEINIMVRNRINDLKSNKKIMCKIIK